MSVRSIERHARERVSVLPSGRAGRSTRPTGRVVAALALALLAAASCSREPAAPRDPRPSIVWIIWDTVRADRMSLYGHDAPTTPHLEKWARDARVFTNCRSVASHTIPSHASMFTGLLPAEHGADNAHQHLDGRHETIAEILGAAGYQTFLFAANPHVSAAENFAQGFQTAAHPWDRELAEEARRIVASKIEPGDRSSELPDKVRANRMGKWDVKASGGALARQSLERWLAARDPGRPFLAVLNYMEAHRPLIPPEEFRRRVMPAEHVERSYEIDRSFQRMWAYVFGLHDYTDEELAIMAGTYDAAIAELDARFHELVQTLDRLEVPDDTVIVLTSDHGEHLGEHHLLDHQYSLYEGVLRVPLVIHAKGRVEPGRDDRPVMNHDVFPTLCELAGIDPPRATRAVSLLAPEAERVRVAQYSAPLRVGIDTTRRAHPGWDPAPWERSLDALLDGSHKLIRWSDGEAQLYDLARDPAEANDLADEERDLARALGERMEALLAELARPTELEAPRAVDDAHLERLQETGYAGGDEDEDEDG